VSAAYLQLLGAQPAIGRLLVPADEQPGHERVAVLTEALWRRRFGAAPDLVGQTITVEGQPFTVVGILSGTFPATRVLSRPLDLYVPLTHDVAALDRRSHDVTLVVEAIDRAPWSDAGQVRLDWVDLFAGDEPRARRQLRDPENWNGRLRPDLVAAAKALKANEADRLRAAWALITGE
jgi:hypothetical protein